MLLLVKLPDAYPFISLAFSYIHMHSDDMQLIYAHNSTNIVYFNDRS